MNQLIAYRQNMEACNDKGETVYIDLFVKQDDKQGTNRMVWAFDSILPPEEKSLSDITDQFHDNEIQGWFDDLREDEFYKTIEHCELDSGINFTDLRKAINEMLRGSNGQSPPIPTVVYMANDENTLSDRDDLEYDYFYARLYYELFVLDLVID